MLIYNGINKIDIYELKHDLILSHNLKLASLVA